jgi:hypothetical protein
MAEKFCSKCNLYKDISGFHKNSTKADGLATMCKECMKEYNKERYKNNKENINTKHKEYRENNKEAIRAHKKEYRENNKEDIHIKNKEYRENNKEVISAKKKEYYKNNKEKKQKYREDNKETIRAHKKEYYENNKENIKEYQENNKEHINARRREYTNLKIKYDPAFRLKMMISRSIRTQLKKTGGSKYDEETWKNLSYTPNELRDYIESQFSDPLNLTPDGTVWMNWNNQGKYNSKTWDDSNIDTWVWNLDHIIPHCVFKYISFNDQSFKDCWALSNLRPYSAKQNILDNDRGWRIKI